MLQHPILKRCLYLILLINDIRLSVSNCNNNISPLVKNGVFVSIKQFPYTAQIVSISSTGSTDIVCGGAIISKRVIVTAAHCVYDDEAGKMFPIVEMAIYLGSSYALKGTKYQVCKTMKHPEYTKDNYFFDLGLILLTKKIIYSSEVKIAKIAKTYQWRMPQSKFTIAGYGSIGTRELSNLRMTRLFYLDRRHCARSQSPGSASMPVPNHMFCLRSVTTTGDCEGDSGSPVTWMTFIVGVVSTGRDISCGSEALPSMYTDLTYFRKWIMGNIKDLESISAKTCTKQIQQIASLKKHGNSMKNYELYNDDCLDYDT